jgi:pimeloyl-ACP methyl ester carboxylesterase
MCAQKDIRPNWPAMQIQALMPNAELAIIEGAAHYIWLTHDDEMRKKLRSFLKLPQ